MGDAHKIALNGVQLQMASIMTLVAGSPRVVPIPCHDALHFLAWTLGDYHQSAFGIPYPQTEVPEVLCGGGRGSSSAPMS